MKKNDFIQYVGSSEQIDKEIRKITSDDSILIDLTGDKELEKLYKYYFNINVLKDNQKLLLAIFKNNIIKKIIINDGHLLNLKTIELLDNLYQMKNIDIILFSTFKSTNNNILFKERFL